MKAFLTDSDHSHLPLREKVEVIVRNGDKYCLCHCKDSELEYYTFPGGGVEPGDSKEETAVKEVLEEAGIGIKNVFPLNLSKIFSIIFVWDDKDIKNSGTIVHYYVADYDGHDYSLYGDDGDSMKFYWADLDEVIEKSKFNDIYGFGSFRIQAMKTLLNIAKEDINQDYDPKKEWYGFDLDGTIVEHNGWKGPEHIGEPIKEIVDLIKQFLTEGKDVRIFTARIAHDNTKEGILNAHKALVAIMKMSNDVFNQILPVTCIKDKYMKNLWDDRATQVEMNTGKILSQESLMKDW